MLELRRDKERRGKIWFGMCVCSYVDSKTFSISLCFLSEPKSSSLS